ncbi:hypothetical protein [Streptomyces sp. JJ36]|uniref:hypothetical protein n=1 Tax=Streptomyces sp. JJ36 TaxID=2736645 RepID=UPI001F2E82EB|nr:hypothetical protein [Streptomyces sp. JJ36]MCF6523673.1 hypothetical protein [Streptomyces sp. JJ36]
MARATAVLLAALAGLLTAVPAGSAAPARTDVRVVVEPDYYLTGPGQGGGTKFPVVLEAARARDVVLTVDAASLRGAVRVRAHHCPRLRGRPYVFRCRPRDVDGTDRLLPFVVGPAKGVRPGDGGTVRYTVTAAGGERTVHTSRVWAGPGSTGLRERREEPVRGVAPGGVVSFTPAVANYSGITPRRFGLALRTRGLRPLREHRNCRYSQPAERAEQRETAVGHTVYCRFEEPLRPGTARTLSEPFRFRVPERLTATAISYSLWLPGEDPAAPGPPVPGVPPRVSGSGPPVALGRAVPREGFPPHGRDSVLVSTTVDTDLQAVATPVEGRVGDVVAVELGARNAGPGDLTVLGASVAGAPEDLFYEIVPPEGTVLDPDVDPDPGAEEETSWICDDHRPGRARYVCRLPETFPAGEERTASFFFRIERRTAGAAGRVRVLSGEGADRPARDPAAGNDTAAIPLTVTGTGGTAVPEGYSGEDDSARSSRRRAAEEDASPGGSGASVVLAVGAAAAGGVLFVAGLRRRHAAIRAIRRFRAFRS